MSITPSISDPAELLAIHPLPPSMALPYSVLGQTGQGPSPCSVLLMGRAHLLNRDVLVKQLFRQGFQDILLVDPVLKPSQAEELCLECPGLRVLVCSRQLTVGSRINLGIRESLQDRVLVIWTDQTLQAFVPENLQRILVSDTLCTVPLLRTPAGDVIPGHHLPVQDGKGFRILSLMPQDGITLFPHDWCGIYHKQAFARMGEYDESMVSSWWQKVEFGCRCQLWGQEIRSSNDLRLRYGLEVESEDTTPDEDYLRFCLKILMPRYDRDHVILPPGTWWRWFRAAGGSWFQRRRQFRDLAAWLAKRSHNYRHDFRWLLELWGQELPE